MQDIKWKEAVAGATAGAATALALHPLDVVKTRMQVQELGCRTYSGALNAIRVIGRKEGVRGLYAGLAPSMVGGAIAWGLYWLSWKSLSSWHCDQLGCTELPWNMKLLCGVEAGVMVTVLTNPIWVVKTRMQLQSVATASAASGGAVRQSLGGCVRNIFAQEGMQGFYTGLKPGLILVSHGAIQMMVYEELKGRRKDHLSAQGDGAQPHQAEALVIGAGAKLIASMCSYPLQVARSRMQQQLVGIQKTAYSTLGGTMLRVLRTEGLAGMYKGFTANVVRVCPQAALQFFIYENARRLLGA